MFAEIELLAILFRRSMARRFSILQHRRNRVFVVLAILGSAVVLFAFAGIHDFAPIVTLSKVTRLDGEEARTAMWLIKDHIAESKAMERLFAHIRVQIPEKSGGALTNGGYEFALLDQTGNEISRGRREIQQFPRLAVDLITTGSNLQIPISAEAKLLKLRVGFQPPSARSRARIFLQRIGLRDRLPTFCDSACGLLSDERKWREKVFEIDLPVVKNWSQ